MTITTFYLPLLRNLVSGYTLVVGVFSDVLFSDIFVLPHIIFRRLEMYNIYIDSHEVKRFKQPKVAEFYSMITAIHFRGKSY